MTETWKTYLKRGLIFDVYSVVVSIIYIIFGSAGMMGLGMFLQNKPIVLGLVLVVYLVFIPVIWILNGLVLTFIAKRVN